VWALCYGDCWLTAVIFEAIRYMQEHQVATAYAYCSYSVYFLHYYPTENEYTIRPTIRAK